MTVTVANTFVDNSWDFQRQRVNQIARIITTQAVTVGGNSAVGDADITGSLRANTLYCYTLYGGSIGNNQIITIGSNAVFTANVRIDMNVSVGKNVSCNNITTNIATANTKIIVGNTIINTSNVVSDYYFGTWSGKTIDPIYGGTGSNTVPASGTVLIGNGTTYINNGLTQGTGIVITPGPGTIMFDNTGVLGFRTSTNTANVYTSWRSGNVTFTATDVVNALGYVPAPTSTTGWYNVGTDLNFYQGNVAIGYTDNNPRSTAKLQILQTDNSTNLPGVLIENQGNNATSGAYINLSVANANSYNGVRFQGAKTNSGAIEYSPSKGFLLFTTANVVRGGIDNIGNLGFGTLTPQPNKGGNGIHLVANNAGITVDNGIGLAWNIGINPNPAITGGTRRANTFGIFSDYANSAILFDGAGNTGSFSVYTNSTSRMTVDPTGAVRINTANVSNGAFLQVGGDIVAEGNFANYSDYRLKNNVNDLDQTESLNRVKSLRPVSFRWKDNNHLEEGFIAHEVKEIIPTAVKGVKDGFDFQTLDKSQLTPTLVKAVQALINIVENQQKEIDRLKGL